MYKCTRIVQGYGGGWQDNEAANFSYKGKPTDYATALIGNKSLEWLGRSEISGTQSEGRPFFLYRLGSVLSVKRRELGFTVRFFRGNE